MVPFCLQIKTFLISSQAENVYYQKHSILRPIGKLERITGRYYKVVHWKEVNLKNMALILTKNMPFSYFNIKARKWLYFYQ